LPRFEASEKSMQISHKVLREWNDDQAVRNLVVFPI